MQNPFVIGPTHYLRPHEESDVDAGWAEWFNDPGITKYMYKGQFPNTRTDQHAHLARLRENRNLLQLAVVRREDDVFVGVVSLNIDWVTRSAEFAIVIGIRDGEGRHVGLEATALMIQHGFDKLNLNRIWMGQHVGHERWRLRAERHLGFQREGTMREAIFSQGRYHDVAIIGLLRRDWDDVVARAGDRLFQFD